ncbi:MAG: pentapeptide repeat-containing protein [Synechococcales cyanobacterium RU_4_20]|nr:pentapeptide repeat-containing protein [Synechococcales cyanobacterium RU_4_20]
MPGIRLPRICLPGIYSPIAETVWAWPPRLWGGDRISYCSANGVAEAKAGRPAVRLWAGLGAVLVGVAIAACLIWPQPAQAFNYNRAIMDGESHPGESFVGDNLSMSKLRRTNLQGTNFHNADLFGAHLEEADLTGADLTSATLDSAFLKYTNLTNANLEGAYVINATFKNVTIEGADFTDVLLTDDALAQLCPVAQGTNPTTGRNTRDTLMCD